MATLRFTKASTLGMHNLGSDQLHKMELLHTFSQLESLQAAIQIEELKI